MTKLAQENGKWRKENGVRRMEKRNKEVRMKEKGERRMEKGSKEIRMKEKGKQK